MACFFPRQQTTDQESIGESIKHLTYKQNQYWLECQHLSLITTSHGGWDL